MRRLLILFCLLFTIPSIAQTDAMPDDLPATIFETVTVSNVEIRLPAADSDSAPELHFVVNETVCEVNIDIDTQAMTFGTLAVNVYGAYEDDDCDEPAPAEQSIALSGVTEDQRYIVLINDFSSQFYLPSRADGTSSEPFAIPWNTDSFLIPFQRVASFVNDVDIELIDDETVSVTLSGDHPDGCETDTFTALQSDQPFDNQYTVDIVRLLPQGVACPAMLQSYDVTIEVSMNSIADPLGLPNFVVDDVIYTEIRENWIAIERERIAVENVTIEEASTSFTVSFDGQIPASCADRFADPAIHDTVFYSQIEFVILRTSDITCEGNPVTETITTTVRSLPVFINGTAYDENGIVAPQATAQTDQNSDGGNFMRVDTVIESVDVIVLESFPMQLQVSVTGAQPDGCDLPVQVEQTVEDDVVTVQIYRDVPLDVMCPAVLVPYEDTIDIDGSFEGGTITININDFTTSVDL